MSIFSGITDVEPYHNPNEGRIIINENFKKMISGVTESGSFINTTHSDLITSVNSSGLTPNSVYYISDENIWVTSLSEYEISVDGFRKMSVVKDVYYTPSSGVLGTFGTYYAAPPSIGDVTVWGGNVWINLSGNTGASVDDSLLDSEWEKIPNTNSTYYVEKIFKIKYDFENNWVFQQEDDRYNIFGNSFELSGINYCDISDWGSELVINNKSAGVFNNIYSGLTAYIKDNVTKGVISNNYGISITSNVVHGDISSNSQYRTENLCYISNNYNVSGITGNGVGVYISNNSNKGSINDNNVSYILFNNNEGDIINSYGSITYNSNKGYIQRASNASRNSNNGYIFGDVNTLCSAYNNTPKSGNLHAHDLGGNNKITKFYRDQTYLDYNAPNTFQEIIGDAMYLDVDNSVSNSTLNLDTISIAFSNSVIQNSIKDIYLYSSTNTPTTISSIHGLSLYNSIRFCAVDTVITFSSNTTGDYTFGNISNKLDYAGNNRDFSFSGIGDFIEYKYTSYPNVGYFNTSTPGLPVDNTIYGIVNEVNSANYSPFPYSIPMSFVYYYVDNTDLNIDSSDTLAWMVRGILGATSHSTIEWTDTLSNPQILNFPADLPPNSTVQKGSYTVNGASRAIDGIYTITVYNDDTMDSITM
jgi:hypothetical protein